MTMKEEKLAAKKESEELLGECGMEVLKVALLGMKIDVHPGAHVTCYDKGKLGPGGVPSRFSKGLAVNGQKLIIKNIRSGSKHKVILVCEIADGEFSGLSFSGKPIPFDQLGVEITAYDLPATVKAFENIFQCIRDMNEDDPRFDDPPHEARPAITTEELAAEGFGAW